MNLSTPLRYLVWALKKFRKSSDQVISLVHALAMTVYATMRFAL